MRLWVILLICCSWGHYAFALPESSPNKLRGKQIYEQYCVVCHREGLVGAPKFRNKDDWNPRWAGKKLDDLLKSAVKGLNAMPAKGSCVSCTEAQLKAAIEYMLPRHE